MIFLILPIGRLINKDHKFYLLYPIYIVLHWKKVAMYFKAKHDDGRKSFGIGQLSDTGVVTLVT